MAIQFCSLARKEGKFIGTKGGSEHQRNKQYNSFQHQNNFSIQSMLQTHTCTQVHYVYMYCSKWSKVWRGRRQQTQTKTASQLLLTMEPYLPLQTLFLRQVFFATIDISYPEDVINDVWKKESKVSLSFIPTFLYAHLYWMHQCGCCFRNQLILLVIFLQS